MLRGLAYAIRTLSILPAFGKDPESIADSLPWFPVTGALLGGLCYIIGIASTNVFTGWPEATGILLLIFGTLITRGFHLDGIADCADGFGAGWTPERRLEIMKDSQLGAFGVIALVLILLAKWIALTKLAASGNFSYIILAYIISRTSSAELSVCLPYARKEGGTAHSCVTGAQPAHRIQALFISSLLCFLFSGLSGLVLLAAGWFVSRMLGIWFTKRVGGITGDLLGTNSEIIEATILFASVSGFF